MELGEILTLYLVDIQAAFRKHILHDNLTLTQALILLTIPDEGLDMTSLSQALGVDNSTATRLTEILIRKQWIAKERSGKDRRIIIVKLTSMGESVRERIEQNVDRYARRIMASIPQDDYEETKEILSSFYWSLVKTRLNH